MRIAFYAPMKPLGHPDPSGDATIAKGLVSFLEGCGHTIVQPSRLRARNIHAKPWLWAEAALERRRAERFCRAERPDAWLTYISYYKSPDVLGPWIRSRTGLPYVLFQGVYSTKRRKRMATFPGYLLNLKALLAADLVAANKRIDFDNLKRIVPGHKLAYVRPGLDPDAFAFDPEARERVRRRLGLEGGVVFTAAMFRPGVKTQSLLALVEALGMLAARGAKFTLVAAGDGGNLDMVRARAETLMPGRARFLGLVPRRSMAEYLSASDLFAYPGIGESLGMAFLEAQSAGLPVAAYADRGALEVVEPGRTGLLCPLGNVAALADAVGALLADQSLRGDMGRKAALRVRKLFDISANYGRFEQEMAALAAG